MVRRSNPMGQNQKIADPMQDWVNKPLQFRTGGQVSSLANTAPAVQKSQGIATSEQKINTVPPVAKVISPQINPAQRQQQAADLANRFKSTALNPVQTNTALMSDLSAQNASMQNGLAKYGSDATAANRIATTASQPLKPSILAPQTAPVRDINEYINGAQAPRRGRRMPRTA